MTAKTKRSTATLAILANLALLLLLGTPLLAQTPQASVQLRLLVTDQGGATRNPTSATFELEMGESGAGHVGIFPPDGAFSGGGSVRDVDPQGWWKETPRRGWDVGVTLVEIRAEEITLDLEWSRFEDDDEATNFDRETVVLGHGDTRVLDFAAADGETEPGSRNFLVEVEAKRINPIASKIVGELWLVHEAPNGEVHSERVALPSFEAGEYQPYKLEGLFVPMPGVHLFGEPLSLQLSAAGRIIAWNMAGDSFEVVSSLRVSLALLKDGQRRGSISGGGEKRFLMDSDDTAALEFPLPDGRFAFAAKDVQLDDATTPGLERVVDRIQIQPEKVFQGHQFWLALTLESDSEEL